MIRIRTIAAALAAFCAGTAPGLAHPHIFIDAGLVVVFDGSGEVASIRHEWRFDPLMSAWQTQGMDADGDGTVGEVELAEIAAETMRGLAPQRFYTRAGEGVANLPLAGMDDARMWSEDGRTMLVFGLEPQSPYRIAERLEIAVFDPEYYVAFSFADPTMVRLENAPEDCGIAIEPPRPLPPELEAQLYSLPPTATSLPPELAAALRGREGAVVVSCGGAGGE